MTSVLTQRRWHLEPVILDLGGLSQNLVTVERWPHLVGPEHVHHSQWMVRRGYGGQIELSHGISGVQYIAELSREECDLGVGQLEQRQAGDVAHLLGRQIVGWGGVGWGGVGLRCHREQASER